MSRWLKIGRRRFRYSAAVEIVEGEGDRPAVTIYLAHERAIELEGDEAAAFLAWHDQQEDVIDLPPRRSGVTAETPPPGVTLHKGGRSPNANPQ